MPRPKVYRNRRVQVVPDAEVTVEQMSYEELYELAKERNVRGRSNMTKDELVDALQ